jgi:hypothetical protein
MYNSKTNSSSEELLKSASAYGKNVKAVAVTGSINAMTTGEDVGTREYNSEEWLPVSSVLQNSLVLQY